MEKLTSRRRINVDNLAKRAGLYQEFIEETNRIRLILPWRPCENLERKGYVKGRKSATQYSAVIREEDYKNLCPTW